MKSQTFPTTQTPPTDPRPRMIRMHLEAIYEILSTTEGVTNVQLTELDTLDDALAALAGRILSR